MEPFVVRHYTGEDRPTIKGNGFDGLEIGENREEAERFVACVNELLKDATAWRNLMATAAATDSGTVVEDSPQRIINAAFRRLGRK